MRRYALREPRPAGDPADDAGGPVAVKALSRPREKDGTGHPLPGGQVDGPRHPGRQGDEGELGTLAQDGDGAVAPLGAQVLDVDATRLRDAQAQQAEQAAQAVVDRTGGRGLAPDRLEPGWPIACNLWMTRTSTCCAGFTTPW